MDEFIYFENDENYMFFDNVKNNSQSCEFENTFLKTLYLREPCECALMEINLPNEVFISLFQTPRTIYLNCTLHPRLFDPTNRNYVQSSTFAKHDNPLYYDKITNQDYTEGKYEFILYNIKNLEDLIAQINKINNDSVPLIEKYYKDRVPTAVLEEKFNYKKPKITFENGYFKITNGHIVYRGMPNTLLQSFLNAYHPSKAKSKNHPPLVTIDDVYTHKKGHFLWDDAVCFYFNFDKELHEILGFDSTQYPYPYIYKFPYIKTVNKDVAIRKFDVSAFDQFYLFTNIVQESYCGTVKRSLLRVFRKLVNENKSEIVSYKFSNLMYMPIKLSEFNSIQFSLTDKYNKVLTYANGHISLTLVIRPIRNN